MRKSDSLYRGQRIALATIHKKELYLNPACEKILGTSLFTCGEKINTDLFGTFSGEVERKGTQKETVLQKCYLGMEISGSALGLANEGSFGPHPFIPFVPSACETLVFVDKNRQLTIFETMISLKTNYQHKECLSETDLAEFLAHVLFPSHGLIVRPNIWRDKQILFKGIQDFCELKKAIAVSCQNSPDGMAHIETDMRAHMNPTRGRIIQKVGIRLFRRLTRLCPTCKTPGWGITNLKRGRPCSICDYPTELPVSYVWSCAICPYKEESPFPGAHLNADPGQCNLCNP